MIPFYLYCVYPIRRDNICFQREIKPQNNVQTRTIDTQSDIACEPNALYELKRIIDEPPAEENEEIGQSDKNVEHGYQSRDVIDHNNSRGNHANQRSRDDERHDQVNAKRHKRRQSRSLSEPKEKVHRSRSPSPHVNGRHSPDKLAPNQVEL